MSDAVDAPEDFVDLLSCFNAENVDYVIVGAHALAVHGSPRATGDLDILVRPSSENAARVLRALVRFGAPIAAHGITAQDFQRPGNVYQMGLPPHRIDVLTEISGVSYDDASSDTVTAAFGGEAARFIGIDAMIRNKRSTGRTKDLADAEALEEIRARR